MINPEVGRTYESTKPGQKEAVKVIWVTGHDDRSERIVMVGHQCGVASITMAQWDEWCERVGASPHPTSGAIVASYDYLTRLPDSELRDLTSHPAEGES